jgi:hypothetical protein
MYTSWLPNLGAVAVVAAELSEAAEAAWLYEQLAPYEGWWSTWTTQGAIAPVATLLGRLSATLGNHVAADAHFERAVNHCREQQSPYFLADALLYQGTARLAAGRERSAADTLVQESLALARGGGFARIERRATAALSGTT